MTAPLFLLTSHLLGEIEELAHRVTVIGAGRVAVSGTVADITAHAGISATTVGRVGANAGPVLQELARSLGDAGTLLLTRAVASGRSPCTGMNVLFQKGRALQHRTRRGSTDPYSC